MVYNIFISYSWAYSAEYEQLKESLNNYPYFTYKEFSIPPADPILAAGTDKALTLTLENRMRLCHTLLVLADTYGTYASWIDREMAIAASFTIPIIAVSTKVETAIPAQIQTAANEIVSLDVSHVVGAVRKHAKI